MFYYLYFLFSQLSDGVYRSTGLLYFINTFSSEGKTFLAEKILYRSFFFIKKTLNSSGSFIFLGAVEKIKPIVGLKLYTLKKRKLQRVIAMPYLTSNSIQYKKAMFWFVKAIKLRKEKKCFLKIVNEFYDVLVNNTGISLLTKKGFYSSIVLCKKVKTFKW